MVDREDVLRLVAAKGPIVPTDITSDLKENSFIIGAMLSELVASKKLFITNAKLGGSPLYYLETQKAGLIKLYNHLNEKDRRAYDILQRDVILYDEPQTPLMRTALRGLKDFAVPFKVTFKGKQLLYWRWYLAPEDQVKEKVKYSLEGLFPESVPKKEEPKQEVEKENKTVEDKPAQVKETPKVVEKKEQENKETEKPTPQKEPLPTPPKNQNTLDSFSANTETIDDEFLTQVAGYLNSLNIQITHQEVVKKKKELNLIVQVPSPVGTLTYFCKARNKKKSNEGDISTAYVEGQMKGFPVLYVSPGDIPKKLENMLETKYKNLKVLKI